MMQAFIAFLIIVEYTSILVGLIDPLVFYLTPFVLLFIFRSYAIVVLGAGLGLLLDAFQPLPGIYLITYPLVLSLSLVMLRRILTHRSVLSFIVMYVLSSSLFLLLEVSLFWIANFILRSPLSIDPVSLMLHGGKQVVFWLAPSIVLYAVLRRGTEIRYGYSIESSPLNAKSI